MNFLMISLKVLDECKIWKKDFSRFWNRECDSFVFVSQDIFNFNVIFTTVFASKRFVSYYTFFSEIQYSVVLYFTYTTRKYIFRNLMIWNYPPIYSNMDMRIIFMAINQRKSVWNNFASAEIWISWQRSSEINRFFHILI